MTQNPSPPEENTEQLYDLALRLLTSYWHQQAQTPQLLAGRIPSPLPLELPLPQDSQVIGSFVQNAEEIQIILDTDQAPSEVIAFYTEQMQGWFEPDFVGNQRREGGFVHGTALTLSTVLCKGRHGPSLGISTFRNAGEGKKTEVRLHLDMRRRNSPCSQSSAIFMEVGALIPSLEPPEGGYHLGGGGGGSDSDSANTSTKLQLDNDLAQDIIVAHYAHQLEQAGWQRTGEGSSGPMGWHTWEFQDKQNERWLGVFSILQVPGIERTYYLQVNINWVGNEGKVVNGI